MGLRVSFVEATRGREGEGEGFGGRGDGETVFEVFRGGGGVGVEEGWGEGGLIGEMVVCESEGG